MLKARDGASRLRWATAKQRAITTDATRARRFVAAKNSTRER